MKKSKFSYELVCAWYILLFSGILHIAQSVDIQCIPIKQCPLILHLLSTKKMSLEMIEFLKFSQCGFDEWKEPKVWCSLLDFCKTPDNINGTCTPVKKCKPFLELAATLNPFDPHHQHYLDKFRCNKILEVVHVCCPTEPFPGFNTGHFRMAHPNLLHRNPPIPPMADRFDYDFDYGDSDYGMIGDEPDSYHKHYHTHSHGHNGDLPKNMHTVNPDYDRMWHNHNGFQNNNKHNQQSTPEFSYGGNNRRSGDHFNDRNDSEDGHSHRNSNEHDGVDYQNHKNKKIDSSGETISTNNDVGNKNNYLPNNSSKRGTNSDETTEQQNGSHRRTDYGQWSTKEPTTPKSKNNANSYTTPKVKTSTTKDRTTPRDDAIIFIDSDEDVSLEKPWQTTGQPTTVRNQTNRDINGSKTSCKTPDRKPGYCAKESDCVRYLKLKNTLDKSKKSTKDYLSKFRCNSTNSRDSYICCQQDEEETIDNSVLNHERTHEDIPEPYSKICGRPRTNTNKIFGGSLADLGEFPWMALLRYDSDKGMMFGCGGTLISNRHVLTAAHCVDDEILRSKGFGKLRQVVLGEYDTRNKTDCIYMDFGEDCADPPKTVGVESIIPHRSYNSETTWNDIALIKLNQEVKFTDFVTPICLPTKTSTLIGNETFVIAGWGRTPTEPSSPILKKAKIPYVKKDNCNMLSPSNRKLIDGQICAGFGNGTDSCSGDSGGPLMINVNFNFEFVTHIVGIISYGFGRCVSGPSVNTYVPYYVDWIKENMK